MSSENATNDRLIELADWLTSPSNGRFAEMQVNRVWFHLMGRRIVDPIDDFRATNPPSHPALLQALTDDSIAHGFDLRHLIRTIITSRTYQLSSARSASMRTSAATVFDLMDINPHTELRDCLNRPLPIATGKPVVSVFA